MGERLLTTLQHRWHQHTGGKSNNLQLLRKPDAKAMLPPDVALPSSVAFPFGVYERVLASPANAVVAAKLQELETALSGDPAKDEGTMQTMRDTIVTQLQAPPELHKELAGACAAVGMPAALTADDEACFDAIKAVWARCANLQVDRHTGICQERKGCTLPLTPGA